MIARADGLFVRKVDVTHHRHDHRLLFLHARRL
jgi:hypothetical protein